MALERTDVTALGAGLVLGGLVAGAFALAKAKRLESRGVVLTQALEAQGSALEAYLTARGDEAAQTIATIGRQEAERIAQRTAEVYLETNFGLTPERMAAISRLGSRFG